MNRYPMTAEGAKNLREELDRLKKSERPRITAAIAEARAHGDLKENAEYHAAREQQGFVEARIKDLEAKLSHIQVIDVKQIPHTGRVIFGATVELYNSQADSNVTYMIVGEDEADIKVGKISVTSPIARGIIGKMEGAEAEIETPGGKVMFEILSVRH